MIDTTSASKLYLINSNYHKMKTQNFNFERLSKLEMSKLSNQEMSVTFGGYFYERYVTVEYAPGEYYTQEFIFDSHFNYQDQYEDFQDILMGYDLIA